MPRRKIPNLPPIRKIDSNSSIEEITLALDEADQRELHMPYRERVIGGIDPLLIEQEMFDSLLAQGAARLDSSIENYSDSICLLAANIGVSFETALLLEGVLYHAKEFEPLRAKAAKLKARADRKAAKLASQGIPSLGFHKFSMVKQKGAGELISLKPKAADKENL